MTTTWTGRTRADNRPSKVVGLQLRGGVWTPAPRAGRRQARFQALDNGILVLEDGGTTGKQLRRAAGVPALIIEDS